MRTDILHTNERVYCKDSNYYRKVRCMAIPGVESTQWSVTDLITRRQFGNGFKDKHFSAYNTGQLHNAFIPNRRRSLVEVENENDHGFNACLSSNGQYLATCGSKQPIRLYDATTPDYKFISKTSTFDGCIIDIDFNPNYEYLAYATNSEFIFLTPTDTTRQSQFRRLVLDPNCQNPRFPSFVFTNCGRIILGASCLSVYEYDLLSESTTSVTRITLMDVPLEIWKLGFLQRDLNVYYAGDNLGMIYLLDRRCGGQIGKFWGHRSSITHIDSDENYLISNSLDNSIKLWDLRRSAAPTSEMDSMYFHSCRGLDTSIRTYTGHEVGFLTAEAKFSPMIGDQKYIYTGCKTGTLVLYDVLTGSIVQKIKGQGYRMNSVAWHSKRSEIITSALTGVSLNVYMEEGI